LKPCPSGFVGLPFGWLVRLREGGRAAHDAYSCGGLDEVEVAPGLWVWALHPTLRQGLRRMGHPGTLGWLTENVQGRSRSFASFRMTMF
jgi:hypothetical protein